MTGGPDGNKTELPTEKRLEEARKKGNFLFSEFVVQLTTLLVGSTVVYFLMQDLPYRFERLLAASIHLGSLTNFKGAVEQFLWIGFKELMIPSLILFGIVGLFSVVGNIAQVGPVFQAAKLTQGIHAVNFVKNAKNLFSKRTLVNLLLSIVKVMIVCFVAYKMVVTDTTMVDRIYANRLDIIGGAATAGQTLWKIALICLISLIPMAVLDYVAKRHFYIKENMMGKDEVKREHRETEGNPEMKSHRRAMAKELVEGVDRLEKASAVIRNPTHIAVVVRFEPSVAPVPYISEMAEGRAAKAIINRAMQMGIPLYEDIPFARALYAQGEVDTHMPLDLSERIIPFVYWLQSNHPDRVYEGPEFASIDTRIGDVKR